MTYWQLIFNSSKANGCEYREPEDFQKWDWPTGTFLQRRLEELREEAANEKGSILYDICWMFLVAIFAYWLGSFIARHPNVSDFIWHALVGR